MEDGLGWEGPGQPLHYRQQAEESLLNAQSYVIFCSGCFFPFFVADRSCFTAPTVFQHSVRTITTDGITYVGDIDHIWL
jgi:hypothetical protein